MEVSVRRGYTVLTFHSLHLSHFVFITKIISRLLNYVPLNEMGIELQKNLKNIEHTEDLDLFLDLTQRACFLVIG